MKANHGKILLGTLTSLLCALITLTASATNYTLTLNTNGSGTVSRNPTNSSYPSGVTVIITATPGAGWYFAGWTGDTNSQLNPFNVVMNSNMTVTGNFLQYPTYALALATNGQGGIGLSPGSGSYQSNTLVTATATPSAGWVFTGWSGAASGTANPISFPVDASGTLAGTFAQLPGFDTEPMSVTNETGSTVSFTSHSVGSAPLVYTWYFSGGTLNNATSATLTLTNITPAQAGTYWVVATNNWGSATSTVVSLVVTNPVGPTNVVYAANEASLQAAIALGGWVGLGLNGTLTLTNTINITNNVVLDGTGVATTISGANTVQLFNVAQGASLTISNLTLANGNCIVTNGSPGTPADGGAIYNHGGMVTLVGCTLTNNTAQSLIYGGLARGGAIFENGGTLLLVGSSLLNNTVVGGGGNSAVYGVITTGTGLGGAIYNTNGAVVILGCNLYSNLSSSACEPSSGNYGGSGLAMGGAVFQASGMMGITNSSFTLNRAVGGIGVYATGSISPGSPAYGGAMSVTGGVLSIGHSQFLNNQADGALGIPGSEGGGGGSAYGGAIYCTANGLMADSTVAGNQALAGNYNSWGPTSGGGGGIYNGVGGILTLNRCAIFGNSTQGGQVDTSGATVGGSGLGGGIYNAAQLAATNCTIAINSASSAIGYNPGRASAVSGNAMGGGVYNDTNAIFSAMNLTIASNTCSLPSYSGPAETSSNGLATGSQIANANGTFSAYNCLIAYSTNSCAYGTITDDGYNICSDGSAALYGGSSYNYTDPKLGPLGNYGGPTLCMALLPTSPAIDNGDSNGAPNTDQRGYPRPFGSGVDMGAYEYGSVLSTTPNLSLSVSGNSAVLSFAMFPSNTYLLQWSTNLTTWLNLSTNGPVTTSTSVTQPVSKQGAPRGFYRLLMQ